MTIVLAQFAQPLSFSWAQQFMLVNAIGRLLLACLLGALVGVERQLDTRAFGIRTNLLICLGSATFTMLSAVLAGDGSPNRGQVASNIVQGIGFLGAGLILHNRSRVSGLASAATVWVVASIGMACGAGLYLAASVAALIVIVAMWLVGILEHDANLKRFNVTYEVRGIDETRILQDILDSLDKAGERLSDVETNAIGDMRRVTFPLRATNGKHKLVRGYLMAQPGISNLLIFPDPEDN
jgi:putative Mg2+ transporter-C (MgtC) family protein